VGINDLSGPVGIVSTINDVGQSSGSSLAAILNVSYLCAFVAVNLAVMNMLPIPALDGGRVFLILVRWVIEKITRKRINPKFEGYIHATGLVLLLGLMAYVMFNDILRIFNG
jgi:regulator of sigma E protease